MNSYPDYWRGVNCCQCYDAKETPYLWTPCLQRKTWKSFAVSSEGSRQAFDKGPDSDVTIWNFSIKNKWVTVSEWVKSWIAFLEFLKSKQTRKEYSREKTVEGGEWEASFPGALSSGLSPVCPGAQQKLLPKLSSLYFVNKQEKPWNWELETVEKSIESQANFLCPNSVHTWTEQE